jgi:nucleotide-binding universal stress UspA family protein
MTTTKEQRTNAHFQKILVGYDGSKPAEKAIEIALSLARSVDAKILVFAVARPPEPPTSVELQAVLDNAREHYEGDFAAIRRLAGEQIELATEIAVGHPAEQIVHKAETDHVDLIVMGRRGVSQFEKWLLGSVSERVLRYAHCPVMVVP